MPYCTNRGKEMPVTDRFCPNHDQNAGQPTMGFGVARPTITGTQPAAQIQTNQHPKSPSAAALLNFFFPGPGRLYVGLGRDMGEVVFGALIFVFFFAGFGVTFMAELFTCTPSASTGSVSPYEALIFSVFLLPFAFANDGYKRAKYEWP